MILLKKFEMKGIFLVEIFTKAERTEKFIVLSKFEKLNSTRRSLL